MAVAVAADDPRGWSEGTPAVNAARVLAGVPGEPAIALPDKLVKQMGDLTLLVYFSPSCPHCQHAQPELNALAKRTEGRLKVAEPKRDKLEIFNEALKDAANEPKGAAVTKKASKKAAADDKAEDKAEEKAETKVEEATEAKAEAAPVEVPAAETPDGAAEQAEATEEITAEDAGKSEA